mgnify:CR=1 FL=1|tara:strand:+ start:24883 stop:29898 length:5016 start_codon:yes stop_codon:yes gene_type:complete
MSERVRKSIDELKDKLLDLTRRNPLISTTFNERNHSYVRIIDEQPEFIFQNIANEAMIFEPLPNIDEPLPDERTEVFQKTLLEAKNSDEIYLKEITEIDKLEKDNAQKQLEADRRLIDRIREKLGLSKRVWSSKTLNLHAEQLGINPSYNLPEEGIYHVDGRHEDVKLQTLLLPDGLDRRLDKLTSKCKSWEDETGVHVLYAAYGFLEWQESTGGKSQYSPLVLQSVTITKKDSDKGISYSVSAADDSHEENLSLALKLKNDFGIELPVFDNNNETLEEYFNKINELVPSRIDLWRVKRQVAIGIFPSSKQIMYNDLSSSFWDLENNSLLEKILYGTAKTDNISINIDSEKIDTECPYIDEAAITVLDADSSQYSVICKVVNGESVAVEGPPGTGKSQTIVNTIAAALNQNKKVLFVAEKNAALNVVKNRLEAIGLGEFCLPILAGNQTRKDVYSRIKDRVDIKKVSIPVGAKENLNKIQSAKEKIDRYNKFLTSESILDGKNNFEIISKYISQTSVLKSLDANMLSLSDLIPTVRNQETIEETVELLIKYEEILKGDKVGDSRWMKIQNTELDIFDIDEIKLLLNELRRTSEEIHGIIQINNFDEVLKAVSLKQVETIVESIETLSIEDNIDIKLLDNIENIQETLSNVEKFLNNSIWKEVVLNEDREILRNNLNKLTKTCKKLNITKIHEVDLANREAELKARLGNIEKALQIYKELSISHPLFTALNIGSVFKIIKLENIKSEEFKRMLCHFLENETNVEELKKVITYIKELEARLKKAKDIYNVDSYDWSVDYALHEKSLEENRAFSYFMPSYWQARKTYNKCTGKKYKYDFARDFYKSLRSYNEDKNEVSKLFEKQFGTAYELFGDKLEYAIELLDFTTRTREKKLGEYKQLGTFLQSINIREIAYIKENFSSCLSLLCCFENVELLKQEGVNNKVDLEELREVRENFILFSSFDKTKSAFVELNRLESLVWSLNSVELQYSKINKTLVTFSLQDEHLPIILEFQRKLETLKKISSLSRDEVEILLRLNSDSSSKDCFMLLKAQLGIFNTNIIRLSSKITVPVDEFNYLISDLGKEINMWFNDVELIGSILELKKVEYNLFQFGLKDFIDKVMNSSLQLPLSDIYYSLFYRNMAKVSCSNQSIDYRNVKDFDMSNLRNDFAKLDKLYIQNTRNLLRNKLCKASPPEGSRAGGRKTWTQMEFIKNEILKTKRFNSIRTLIKQSNEALLEIMPCWMMSPMAVAQNLRKGRVDFDLVIIDEASQMTPENALGALLRAKEAMIVGDTNQLPPTNFFKKTLEIDDESEDSEFSVVDESILERANLSLYPQKRLLWHYRSKHSSLISFSNEYIYNNELLIFPNVDEVNSTFGVSLIKVEGIYSGSINIIEARAIVEFVINEMHLRPNQSLGVVVLNQKQKDLIDDELSFAIKDDIKCREYIKRWSKEDDGLQTFFVKNLENVQGDERDTIVIGTVYGPDETSGKVYQRFGPINGPAGRRRLNVLFTRAKLKIVTFSSLKPSDIQAQSGVQSGAWLLKKWLEYCETKIINKAVETGKEPDSDFERHVIKVIESMGCIAVPQVGVSGYYIDIGVRHPSWDYGYLLAVECDGASYHSSKSARDRDRLRQEILESMGWDIHRIWSTDWFSDPISEAHKLRAIIESKLQKKLSSKGA